MFLHMPPSLGASLPAHRQPCSPVQFQLVGQHPPVVAPGLGSIQAAAQLLPYRERDAESTGPYDGGDGACCVHGRIIDASRFLRLERQKKSLNNPSVLLLSEETIVELHPLRLSAFTCSPLLI